MMVSKELNLFLLQKNPQMIILVG